MFEDGAQQRSFIHVRDVAAANLAAMASLSRPTEALTESGFRAYNVGADEVRTIGDVAAALSTLSGGPAAVVTGEFRLGDVRHITASSQRIKDELGWSPAVGFEQGMREFASAPLRGA